MERRRLEGEAHVLVATGLEGRGVLAAFTERSGGYSEGPFRSLNLSFRGDDPARVRSNRERVVAGLGVSPFAVARQVHGATVRRVGASRAGAGFDAPDAAVQDADALAVSRRGLPVALLTADCLPLVLASRGRLVAVHAGWRGLAAGIVDRALETLGADGEIVAALGPAIGPCHYEVGEEVVRAVAAGSGAGAVFERAGERYRLDLPATAGAALRAAGVREVEEAGVCTACEEERFFSHRRSGVTGRQALVAMLL